MEKFKLAIFISKSSKDNILITMDEIIEQIRLGYTSGGSKDNDKNYVFKMEWEEN